MKGTRVSGEGVSEENGSGRALQDYMWMWKTECQRKIGLVQSLSIQCPNVGATCVPGQGAPEEDGPAAAAEHLPAAGD